MISYQYSFIPTKWGIALDPEVGERLITLLKAGCIIGRKSVLVLSATVKVVRMGSSLAMAVEGFGRPNREGVSYIVGLFLILAQCLQSQYIWGPLRNLARILGSWRVVGLSPFGWIIVRHKLGRWSRSLTNLTRMPIEIDAYLISVDIYVLGGIEVVANARLGELLRH